MVIFQYNLYIFGIHLRTMLYLKLCYNEPCYKKVVVYKENINKPILFAVYPAVSRIIKKQSKGFLQI